MQVVYTFLEGSVSSGAELKTPLFLLLFSLTLCLSLSAYSVLATGLHYHSDLCFLRMFIADSDIPLLDET